MRKSSAVAAQHAVLDPSTIAGLYGMVITGSCMVPTYPDGAIARVCPEEPYKKGDVVVAWIRPEFRKPGSPPALIKRIVMMPPPYVTFPFRDRSLRAAFDSRKLWLRVQLWRARRMFDRADRLKERGNRILDEAGEAIEQAHRNKSGATDDMKRAVASARERQATPLPCWDKSAVIPATALPML